MTQTSNHNKSTIAARNKRTGMVVMSLAAGMLGLAFASAPLYKLFCSVTGYGGTPKINAVLPEATGEASNRIISVTLDANVMSSLNWTFKPDIKSVDVKLGEENLVLFRARNDDQKAITGTAVFNVTPFKVAKYVSKIDCFCFTEQRLEAGEEMPMAVSFYIDPAISDDRETKNLNNIVLSYTFYPSLDSETESKTAMLGDPINVE